MAGKAYTSGRKPIGSSDASSEDEPRTWVENFMAHDRHKYFCKVDYNYINDNFNLYGLREEFPYFRAVHNVVKGYYESSNRRYHMEAEKLYGLIHARFILTTKGLGEMLKKFRDREFGNCRNNACEDFPLLPIGLHTEYGYGKVKLYCRCCQSVFRPARSSKFKSIDGSFWGPTFPHLFFCQFCNFIRTI